jgi:ESCRT-II complex subunit VPS36
MRIFPSGLSVLHTPPYTHASFTARLAGLLALSGPKTTMEVAQEEAVAVAMAAEMIDAVESEGHLCRDDPSGAAIRSEGSGAAVELRWWTNPFRDYVWDGCM